MNEKLILQIDEAIDKCQTKEFKTLRENLKDLKTSISLMQGINDQTETFYFDQLANQTANPELNTDLNTILHLLCVYIAQIDNSPQNSVE